MTLALCIASFLAGAAVTFVLFAASLPEVER